MEPVEHTELHPRVVLGVVAHPDDLDVIAAGTMALFASEGAEIHYLILTDGGKGSDDRTVTSAELTTQRRDEQRQALKIIGGTEASFLDYPDGGLEITMNLKRDIVRAIRRVKPDVLITIDPSMLYSTSRGYINHPDHRAAGQAALDAAFPLARDHLTFPELLAEGLEPHKTQTLLLSTYEKPNYYVDISKVIDTKIKAVQAHASQMPPQIGDFMRQNASTIGKAAGYEYAEGFNRIDLRF